MDVKLYSQMKIKSTFYNTYIIDYIQHGHEIILAQENKNLQFTLYIIDYNISLI